MTDNSKKEVPSIGEVAPREIVGRDTIARFQAQFRAAAYECLSILSGKTIDRVYCDFQDDFVSRDIQSGNTVYHFYQVKTKSQGNFQWGKLDLFGLKKRGKPNSEKIASSVVGKLMFHTIRFNNSCGNVVFLTNVQLNNEVETIAGALNNGDFSNDNLRSFFNCFNAAFVTGEPLDKEAIEEKFKRLQLKPGVRYLDPHGHEFDALARDAIFKYSEIDLQHVESEQIIRSLISLVEKKSFSKLLSDVSEAELDELVGVGISDLLEILSISKGAYQQLLAGGDPSAIKNASIIQRKLSEAKACDAVIEYCSKCKVEWDIWLRDKRHMIPEFDLNLLLDNLNGIKNSWISGQSAFADLRNPIDVLWGTIIEKGLAKTMSKDILLGGVFSAIVRSESQ